MSTNVPLRAVILLHALGILIQAVFAGQFLSGADSSVTLHETTGWIIAAVCLVQIVLADKNTPLWFVISSVLIFLGEALQVGTGYGRFLNVHIPLSILITCGVVAQAAWAFRKRPLESK